MVFEPEGQGEPQGELFAARHLVQFGQQGYELGLHRPGPGFPIGEQVRLDIVLHALHAGNLFRPQAPIQLGGPIDDPEGPGVLVRQRPLRIARDEHHLDPGTVRQAHEGGKMLEAGDVLVLGGILQIHRVHTAFAGEGEEGPALLVIENGFTFPDPGGESRGIGFRAAGGGGCWPSRQWGWRGRGAGDEE